jgi:Tol biopolymer transport system component
VLDYSFSQEGSMFVFAGARFGKTDIYIFDIASSTNRQITNDLADDNFPRFIENDNKIIFSSNRLSDTLSAEIAKPAGL